MLCQRQILRNQVSADLISIVCAAVLAFACSTGVMPYHVVSMTDDVMPYHVVSMTDDASHEEVCRWKAYMEAMSELLRTAACWAAWLVVEGALEGSPVSPNAAPRLFSSLLHPACTRLCL